MKSFLKYSIIIAIVTVAMVGTIPLQAQVKMAPDTLECHMVGFTVGTSMPLSGSSTGLPGGNMKDLYSAPNIDFGIDWAYKYQSGWLLTFDAGLWFGLTANNLKDPSTRLGSVYDENGIVIAWNGVPGEIEAFNRGLMLKPGVGYLFRIFPKNPNSGILMKMSAGWMMHKTVFNQSYEQTMVPQLHGDYAKLYDHYRNGLMLTESIGILYMNNYRTYANFKVSIELSQCLSWSSRPYQIDNVMGLNGKDHGRYFDLMAGIRFTWFFPFTGKTSYDYYYF